MIAQQPFLTDDANVAPIHKFHLELISEYDRLSYLAYPSIRQNTTRLQLTYGLLNSLEIGCDAPLIAIYNTAQTPNAFGLGDVDLQMKYVVLKEHAGSAWPAVTVGFYVEVPTGNSQNQLGSGLADYWLNGILQKQLTERLTYHLNMGLLFSGNTLTGAVGIEANHGKVFTGASSLTYQASRRWLIGTEIVGALTGQVSLGKAQLQGLMGAKFQINHLVGLDFAVTGGKFEGSPRLGGAFGISMDF